VKDSGDESSNRNLNRRLTIKRFLDVIVSGLALVILFIPFLIIGAAIKLESKGPVFFRQERMGKDAKPFMIYKFRTMLQGSESIRYYIVSDNPSVTKLGRWMRRWGLDELPQLLNVLKGEMSLVGPRPTLRYQVENYNEEQKLRLNMKPGLTGWAQVNGRNKLNWSQRMKYDLLYTQHWSLRLDAKIFLLTPIALLRRDFAFADGVAEDDIVRGV
jgi:undecaprenyl phosphate N,N'-diacetylbacillosamine 1-phosphate transferase